VNTGGERKPRKGKGGKGKGWDKSPVVISRSWQHCKFGQLILRKIIEIVATGCQILWQNAPNLISP